MLNQSPKKPAQSKSLQDKGGLGKDSNLSVLIFGTAALVTLIIHTGFMDPLNRPKLFLLVFFALFLSMFCFFSNLYFGWKRIFLPVFLTALASFAFLLSSVFSNAAFSSSLLGSRGRQLGSLTYVLFLFYFVLSLLSYSSKSMRQLLVIFALLAGLQISYGLIQNSGQDFIDWNNPYSPIIQTFGNPNFASAFNGIGVIVLLRIGWLWRRSWFFFSVCCVLALSGIYLIVISSSSQGVYVVLAFSIIITLKYSFDRNIRIGTVFLLCVIPVGILGLVGTLNKGPFSQYIYQSSISARGDYWRAAFRMFMSNPITGVGLDNFGSYYGESRDLIQVSGRGYATVSDNAHNVYLQLAATGGLLVIVPYLLIISFVSYCAVRLLSKTSWSQDADVTIVIGAWFSTLLINFISIENIGYSVWQWIIAGIIVGCYYDGSRKTGIFETSNEKKAVRALLLLICAILSSVFYKYIVPMARAEINLKSSLADVYGTDSEALVRDRFEKISSLAPWDESIVSQLASISSQKKYPNLAIFYAQKGLELNARNLDLLKFEGIAYDDLKKYEEAIKIRIRIRKLDPYNMNNLALLAQNYILLKQYESAETVLNDMSGIDSSSEFIDIITKMIEQSRITN